MMLRFAAMIATLVTSTIANSETPLQPFEFRGITTAPLSSVNTSKVFRRCSEGTTATYCSLPLGKVAGVEPLEAPEVAYNKDGSMSALFVKVHAGFDKLLLSALTEKYGPPCDQQTKGVQNGFGAIVERLSAKWCFSDGNAIFQSPGRRINEASFTFLSNHNQPMKGKVDF